MNSKELLEQYYDYIAPQILDEIIEVTKPYFDKLEQLEQYEKQIKRWVEKYAFVEKQLIQTKKNFRNSQTHSKNCYKKLKEKYEKLEKAYKNNEVMVRDLNELITRNLELKDELNRSQETIRAWVKNQTNLIIDNGKMKRALDILKSKFIIEFKDVQPKYFDKFYTIKLHEYNTIECGSVIGVFEEYEKEDYELLKEVLINE